MKNSNEPKVNTYEETLKLFNEGKNQDEIAKERGLTKGTIESHLFKAVKDGKISIDVVSSQDKIDKIKEAFRNNTDKENKEIKEMLGNDYSWSEIRFAKETME